MINQTTKLTGDVASSKWNTHNYHQLEEQWPKERVITALEEVFQPW